MGPASVADQQAASRILQRCDELAAISSMTGAVCRTYLTDQHRSCNTVVGKWMQEANMRSWVDEAGNVWGSYHSDIDGAPTLIIGSHLDTVPNAGKYDGILGVLTAIEFVDRLNKLGQRLSFNIDIVGFGDEEGVRFGATLLGSRAVAGTWDPTWLSVRDENQISMADAFNDFHGELRDPTQASRADDNLLAYLELHIEQGPVLEQQNLPVGIVSSIAGARRFKFEVIGMAGHAGTVPMDMRVDALSASARIVLKIEELARRSNVVATVGKINTLPGSINVIPGRCHFTLDIRSGRDESRDLAVKHIFEAIEQLRQEFGFIFSFEEVHTAGAVKCASWIQRAIEQAIEASGVSAISLVSGAGHDAMAFADVCDIGMIFVRCEKGISHHPAEAVTLDDVGYGLEILGETVFNLQGTT